MTYPRTMRRGSHALTGIHFTPEDDAAAAAEATRIAAEAEAEAAKSKLFTPEQQAAVDRIVQERVARAKATPPEDYDDLKAAKARLDELEAANATELEKATKRAEDAEQAAAKVTATANERLVQAAILAQATSQKAIKPEHLHKLIDTAAVTVGDDGQVTGAEEAVKTFLEANPEYVGTTRASGDLDQGARGNGAEQLMSTEGMSAEAIAEALAEGRFDKYLAKPK